MTIKAEMIEEGGNDFWVVSCISSGGRPDADISLALNATDELQRENATDSDTQRLSVRLPAAEYAGHNISCLFNHLKFSQPESRVTTLPTFCEYISDVKKKKISVCRSKTKTKLKNLTLSADLAGLQFYSETGSSSDDERDAELLELEEGKSGAAISLEVTGNVPRYNVICKK